VRTRAILATAYALLALSALSFAAALVSLGGDWLLLLLVGFCLFASAVALWWIGFQRLANPGDRR